MIDITYEINGRKVNPRNLGNALEKAMLEEITSSIKKSVGNIRCKEHGSRPKVKVKGRSLDNLNIQVEGCCDDLIKQVERKLK